MATVSDKIVLGKTNTVEIEAVPRWINADISITIGGNEVYSATLPERAKNFVWDLGFETNDFKKIFGKYFSYNQSSVSAKVKISMYFYLTGVPYLPGNDEYDISFQLIESEKTKPVIDSVTVSVLSDKEYTKYIQGKTKAKCVVGSHGQYEAEIKSVSVTIDGGVCAKENDLFVSNWLKHSGYRNVVVTVTDSRGFRNTHTEKIYVEPYSPPVIVPQGANPSLVCRRWNPNEGKFDDANGTQCKIQFGVYASYIEGINDSFQCSYSYKIANDDEFIYINSVEGMTFASSSSQTGVDLLIADNTETDENGKQTGLFGVENEYLIELTVTDSLGEKATKTFRLDVLECIWHIGPGGKRFSVGKYATKDELLDSAWDIHTDKNIDADGNISAKGTVSSLGTPLSVANGGTGATTAAEARKNLEITLKNLGVSSSKDDIDLLLGVKSSGVTTDNIKALYGIKSNIQDQIDKHTHAGYAPSAHNHDDKYAVKNHSHSASEITSAPVTVSGSGVMYNRFANVTFVSSECWATTWGKVCEIYITFTYDNDLSEGDIANIDIGYLANSYLPNHHVSCHSGGGGIVASGEITDKGLLRLASLGSAYVAGKKLSLTATYLLP